jgi:hypothetical protein
MGEEATTQDKTEPVREQTEDGVLKVVNVEKVSHNELRVMIEGTDLERLTGPEARKLAFEQRLNHGMANAGVEALAGTFVPQEEYDAAAAEERDVNRWHREFKLVGML